MLCAYIATWYWVGGFGVAQKGGWCIRVFVWICTFCFDISVCVCVSVCSACNNPKMWFGGRWAGKSSSKLQCGFCVYLLMFFLCLFFLFWFVGGYLVRIYIYIPYGVRVLRWEIGWCRRILKRFLFVFLIGIQFVWTTANDGNHEFDAGIVGCQHGLVGRNMSCSVMRTNKTKCYKGHCREVFCFCGLASIVE